MMMPAIFMSALYLILFGVTSSAHRILHEPLYPIQWTPPPPPFVDISETPPDIAGTTTAAAAVSAASPRSDAGKNFLIGATVFASTVALALIGITGFLLYRWQRRRRSPDSGKLIGGDDRPSGRSGVEASSSQPEFLYLGTVEPATAAGRRRSGELNGSPYRKLGTERVLETDDHASPELKPLPPLRTMTRSRLFSGTASPPPPPPAPAVESDDDETYYTSKRSLTSATTGSPDSPAARRSVPTNAGGEIKEPPAPPPPPPTNPRSRRSSPRMRLSVGSNSELKQMIPPVMVRQPPPPPPPPPKIQITNRAAVPPPPPLPPPTISVDFFKKKEQQTVLNSPIFSSSSAEPLGPSSRRRLLKPLPPEAILINRPVSPSAEIGGGMATSVQTETQVVENFDTAELRPKLKPLHWDKVRASSDRAMVWDQFKSSSFQLNEDMIETLFVNNGTNALTNDGNRRQNFQQMKQENRVLDPKKSQNIAILLRALNVTTEEVSEALSDGNPDALGAELLETLVKMAPTKQEELKLRVYSGDVSKLGSAERFLKTILDIPFAFKRVDAMLYRANFDTEVKYLMRSYGTLEAACEDLRSSRLFLKLLEAVLRTGNRMNVGTNRGQAQAFKLDTLLKLADVKGTDGKTTLLHFVVQEIIRSEGAGNEATATSENTLSTIREEQFKKQGLKVVSSLSSELGNVRKAAGMDSDVLSSYVSKLESGLQKIKSVLQLEKSCSQGTKFFDSMKIFLQNSERDIEHVKAEEKRALLRVKDITEYFHGDAAKEGHPFRIFMVVRDFLCMLDNVCKEVGIVHDRSNIVSAGSFRISASASLPVLQRCELRRDANVNSDYDSSSS